MHAGRAALAVLEALLVFALILGMLSGCGIEDKGSGKTPNAAAHQAEESPSTEAPVADVAEAAAAAIDEPSIHTSLSHLTGASPAPLASGATTISERGSEVGRRAAAEYMQESFEAAGIPARILEFTSGDRRGFNVEATLQGTGGGKHLCLTAHLDSFYNPGASDDASGLVSLLMTARTLKELDPKHTVHFVAYDLEEVGLVGSAVYIGSVVSATREREGEGAIIGNLHSDMIGYDRGQREAVIGTCNRAGSIDEAILRASEMMGSPLNLNEDCLGRSDHQHFWDAGLPAAILTDGTKYDLYPWYHDPADTVDKLNIPYLRSMIQLTAATTALLTITPEDQS
jgi:hypothetical protein